MKGRGKAITETGIASMDLRRNILRMSQFCDDQLYNQLMTKVHMLDPVEVCKTLQNLFSRNLSTSKAEHISSNSHVMLFILSYWVLSPIEYAWLPMIAGGLHCHKFALQTYFYTFTQFYEVQRGLYPYNFIWEVLDNHCLLHEYWVAYKNCIFQIVVAATLRESSVLDAMFDKLNRNFPAAKIQCVPRRYMNENKGKDYINKLCSPDSSGVDIALKSK